MVSDKYRLLLPGHPVLPGRRGWALAGDGHPRPAAGFVESLQEVLARTDRPAPGLIPQGDLKAQARVNKRLEKLTPSLREEVLHRLEGIELGEIVLTHGDLTGENLLVKEDGSLVVIDWADARLAPAWYELGPIAFELFQGRGELLRLFAGADREAFIERLLDCCCLHDFGADFLWNFWQREGVAEFQSLAEVRELLEKKLGRDK